MGVFIGNLPTGTTTSDLLDFFGENHAITDIELVKRRSEQGEVRYGRIIFETDNHAEQAIVQQRQAELYGSAVVVRKYTQRGGNNDRRIHTRQAISWSEPERRSRDRRWNFKPD